MPDAHQLSRRRLQALAAAGSRHEQPRAQAPIPVVDGNVATIRLYEAIDDWGEWWGVSAREFATALDELPTNVTEIHLLINSPGGMVFEGLAITNVLRRHRARIVAIVEGLAASAASFIACSADEVVMMRNSQLMIHDAWGYCLGNAGDMREYADLLDRWSDNVASIYAAKAGGTTEEWRDTMRGEAWYSADEAVAAGLADRVDNADPSDDDTQNRFDLSVFQHAGREHAPAPHIPTNSTDTPATKPVIEDDTIADPAPAGSDDGTATTAPTTHPNSLNAARLALLNV